MTPTKLRRLCDYYGYDIALRHEGAVENREVIARIMFVCPDTIKNYLKGTRSIDPARYKLLGLYFGDEQAIKDSDKYAGRFGR